MTNDVNNARTSELTKYKDFKLLLEHCEESEKHKLLSQTLEETLRSSTNESKKMMVFVETKKKADTVVSALRSEDYPVAVADGGDGRDVAFREFSEGKCSVLVSSVPARELDVKNVDIVINFDFPKSVEEFINRIGFVGLEGTQGIVMTYLTPGNMEKAKELLEIVSKQDVSGSGVDAAIASAQENPEFEGLAVEASINVQNVIE